MPLNKLCIPILAWFGGLASLPVQAQFDLDLGKSYLYVPADTTNAVGISHIKVPGIGNFDVTLKFNPLTLAFDLDSATPSQTDENTEQLAGLYTCSLYNGTLPIFSTTIRPVGRDLVFGAGLLYRFIGTTGSNVWKYTVSFDDGGKYLLSMVKANASSVTAVLGYLSPGQTDLDPAQTLKCEKKG